MKTKKTNALRQLDAKKIAYETISYPVDENDLSGAHILQYLPLGAEAVFKTLVLKGEKKGLMVVCVPCLQEIDLKKLANAVGDKKVEMIPTKELLATTGYLRGGCSPVGMKKHFPTYFDKSCLDQEKISVSAGIRGMQMVVKTTDLLEITQAKCIDVARFEK